MNLNPRPPLLVSHRIRRLLPEFLPQELLNSFFCLFCKPLRVFDGVFVSNVNPRDQ